ncbi:hypothetical protein ACRALDRAFT_2023005, partial [Sodiomyces alcalophilus JCM 7366]|uniref:uncharacterized protein n=1 Tax=Sodiomyces alcalophilus JCM 7366 TaxID=591952 RepID=UPI0039B38AB9
SIQSLKITAQVLRKGLPGRSVQSVQSVQSVRSPGSFNKVHGRAVQSVQSIQSPGSFIKLKTTARVLRKGPRSHGSNSSKQPPGSFAKVCPVTRFNKLKRFDQFNRPGPSQRSRFRDSNQLVPSFHPAKHQSATAHGTNTLQQRSVPPGPAYQ